MGSHIDGPEILCPQTVAPSQKNDVPDLRTNGSETEAPPPEYST